LRRRVITNIFYNPSGNPATGSFGLSSLVRGEFAAIGVAFDSMPAITTTGAFSTVFNQQGDYTFTLPAANGTLALNSDVAANAAAIAAETSRAAPKDSPTFTTGATLSYTLATLDNSSQAVSSHWVANFLAASGFAPAGLSPVLTVATRTGNVTLTHADITDWAATIAPYATTAATAASLATETAARIAADAIPSPGQLFGLTLSNDAITPTTMLDVAAGSCADSTNAVTITLGAFKKSPIGGWLAGSGAGGMGTGLAASASTWYHAFAAIIGGTADIFFDTTSPPTHAPAGTTFFRRLGSIKLDAAVHILPFAQNADRFDLVTPVLEYNGTPGVTTGAVLTLSGVPPGVAVEAMLSGVVLDSAGGALYLSSLAQADLAAISTLAVTVNTQAGGMASVAARVVTNTSAQIRRRSNTTVQTVIIITNGWIDTRGRLS
jgi:hypothetical protein